MYAIQYCDGETRTSAEIQRDLGKVTEANINDGDFEVYQQAFKHNAAIERIECRGTTYANQDFDILSAADSFVTIHKDRRGIRLGDTIRTYGCPGTFTAGATKRPGEAIFVSRTVNGIRAEMSELLANIVEINGKPVPLLSCPICWPADDYPHTPTFDYDDGPKENGERIAHAWKETHATPTA